MVSAGYTCYSHFNLPEDIERHWTLYNACKDAGNLVRSLLVYALVVLNE